MKHLIILLTFVGLFFSCQKENESEPLLIEEKIENRTSCCEQVTTTILSTSSLYIGTRLYCTTTVKVTNNSMCYFQLVDNLGNVVATIAPNSSVVHQFLVQNGSFGSATVIDGGGNVCKRIRLYSACTPVIIKDIDPD